MSDPLFQLQNPFTANPNFNQPQDNFIQKGISDGIEKGLGKVGDNLFHIGQLKAQNFAQNLPELIGIAYVSYLVYLGYKTFFKHDIKDLEKVFPVTICYVIFKLFWKVVLHI